MNAHSKGKWEWWAQSSRGFGPKAVGTHCCVSHSIEENSSWPSHLLKVLSASEDIAIKMWKTELVHCDFCHVHKGIKFVDPQVYRYKHGTSTELRNSTSVWFFALAVVEQHHSLATALTRKQNRARTVTFYTIFIFLHAPWHAFTLSMALSQIIPGWKLRFVATLF